MEGKFHLAVGKVHSSGPTRPSPLYLFWRLTFKQKKEDGAAESETNDRCKKDFIMVHS